MNVVDDIQKLVNEGGSSAYLLYLQQQEAENRKRWNEQNGGVFETNQYLVKNKNHESFSHILVPNKFKHQGSLSTVQEKTKEFEDIMLE